MKSIYLAGPDVFLPDYPMLIAKKAKLVRDRGFLPLFAGVIAYPELSDKRASGLAISAINELLMRGADAIVANLTPFRGLAADSGTVFELGFMSALGKPVFAYTNSPFDHRTRILHHYSPDGQRVASALDRAIDGTLIEDFDMIENLMLDGAIYSRSGTITCGNFAEAPLNTDLTAFCICLDDAAANLSCTRQRNL